MSDTVITGIVTGVLGLCTTIFTGYMAFLMAKLNVKQADAALKVEEAAKLAAAKVEEVKKTLDASTREASNKLVEMAKVGVDTHTLVNSATGRALLLYMEARQEIAEIRPTEGNIKIAEAAKRDYEEHVRKQAVVDKDAGKPDSKPHED